MKRTYCNTFAVALIGYCLILADVGQAAETKPLPLREATKIAIEHNLGTQLAASQITSSELYLSQGKKELYPSASFDASTSRQFDDLDISPSTRSVSASISANVNLFKGFADDANVRKLQYSLSATQIAYERARQSLILQISSNFLDVTTNQELVKVAAENLDAQKAQLTLVQAYYDAGRRALADLYQQQAATAQAELDLLTAQNNLQISWLQLFRNIGIPADSSYSITSPSDGAKQVSPSPDLALLLDQALKTRPDIQQQTIQLDVARQSLRAAHSGIWPILGLSASTGSRYQSNIGGNFSDQFSTRSTNVGLGLSIPLYDKSRTSLAVQQSRIALDNGEKTLADTKRQVTLEVEQALLNLQSSVKQLAVADAQVEFSKQSLAAMQERYNVGAATMVELTQARALLVQASGNRIRTLNKLLLARLSLGAAVGDIDAVLGEF